MKLYFAPLSCSLASRIALAEAGIPAEFVEVSLGPKTLSSGESYRGVSAKGQVPALELEDGAVLTEGPAVLQYIADLKPASRLAPAAGTLERYRLQEWLGYLSTELHKLVFWAIFNPETPEAHRAYVRSLAPAKFAYVASKLADRPYLLGDHFSVADAYLFTITNWCEPAGISLAEFPELGRFRARVAARPAVAESLGIELALRGR
jgi:glutathione S-transferase